MNIIIAWFKNYSSALKYANTFADLGFPILDCAVIGKYSQLIVETSTLPVELSNSTFLENLEKCKSQSTHFKFLKNLKKETVSSYLSLSSKPIEDFIYTIESEFLGDILEIANNLLIQNFSIVDLRLIRIYEPKVILMITGKSIHKDKAEIIFENIKSNLISGNSENKNSIQIEYLENINSQIRELF